MPNTPGRISLSDLTFYDGVPAIGGLKFSMAQKKVQKSASWGKGQLGEVPVGGGASWGKCQFGEVPVGGSASWGKCQLGDKGQLKDKF